MLASACLEGYRFPVQIFALLPDATLVNTINANDLLDIGTVDESEFYGYTDPLEMRYYQFLMQSIVKATSVLKFSAGQAV